MKPLYKKRTDCTCNEHLKDVPYTKADIMFLGDSHFERMEKYIFKFGHHKIFYAGVGGDKLCNILYRIETKELIKHISPSIKTIVLMAGTNNIFDKMRYEDIGNGLINIIDTILSIRHFDIIVCSIPPIYNCSKFYSKKVVNYNKYLKENLNQPFIDWSSLIHERHLLDVFHLNDIGYKIFSSEINKFICGTKKFILYPKEILGFSEKDRQITKVHKGKQADKRGMTSGMIIISVNNMSVIEFGITEDLLKGKIEIILECIN